MALRPDMHVLDIGSGLGGPSRFFVERHGCRVTGIDLTREYVEVAAMLAERTGLAGRVTYRQGSAAELPFETASFDAAVMLHVGMNIPDKAILFAAVRRVLRPGAVFGVYDVMGEGALSFPLPWASIADTSFVASAATYRTLLETAGFRVESERSRRGFALDFFADMRARAAGGVPPLGLHLVMGATWPQKVANMVACIQHGLIAPTEMIARAA